MRGQAEGPSGGTLSPEKRKALARVPWRLTRLGILVLGHACSDLWPWAEGCSSPRHSIC